MPTVSKVNDVLCANISKVDDILKANASKMDDIDFCSPTPTMTPTRTPGGSPVPTQTMTPTRTATPTRTPPNTPPITPDPTKTPTPTPSSGGGVSPTPTPTPTMTPTPSPCALDCCLVELCYSQDDCVTACQCNDVRQVYLHICVGAACRLEGAFGIFDDKDCTTPSAQGYYVDASGCYYWDGSSLIFSADC